MAVTRELTNKERAGLSPGLVRALDAAGARPCICEAAHPGALISRLWRGYVPILTLGQTIHWPQAVDDFSNSPGDMAVLQHELHHALEFSTGVLTPLSYITNPKNWTYEVTVTDTCQWCDFGAEQRAVLAERLWWAERKDMVEDLNRISALVPWAAGERAAA